ncbi:hypothetical protein [Fusobacterium sp.]|uniref:hypothetical protein n=1 Tax=Fusobacterium sp. TaxID=68766 RepID=UPI00260F24CC|nr:hypothetical protein [Fusobacterium sp.]
MKKSNLKKSIIDGLTIAIGTMLNGILGMKIINTDNIFVIVICWFIVMLIFDVVLVILEETYN